MNKVEKMTDLILAPFVFLENAFFAVGLGGDQKAARLVAVSVLAGTGIWYAKPASMFDKESQEPLPFSLTAEAGTPGTTPLPWWLFSMMVGGASVLFV